MGELYNLMNRLAKLLIVIVSAGMVLFLVLGSVLGRSTTPEDIYRHFAVYTEVLTRIKSEYVEEPNMKDVTLGALNGLLESIDPYASYLDEDQYKQYLKVTKDAPAGLGLVLSRKVGYVSVVDAVPGSPADKAGLTTGDMIETIDGVATRGMPLAYAEMLLRGKKGTEVELTILRVRQSAEPQKMTLVRDTISNPPVRTQMLPGNVAHIRVESLEAGKAAKIKEQLVRLQKNGAKKILLDLRGAASGSPEEGIALADLFLDKGLLGYLEGQKVAKQEFRATPESTITAADMVVVINRGTASGAEVAAAALLGNGRCEVVGERSYGDAAMRKPVRLNDGGAVILSVAKYHSPEGKAIQDTGVTPSVVSIADDPAPPEEGEEFKIQPTPELPVADDTILQKALEVLAKGKQVQEVAREKPLEEAEPNVMTPLGIPRRQHD